MAVQDRQHAIDIKKLLVEKGRRIPFVQSIRLLRLLVQQKSDQSLDEDAIFKHIRVRPELSLDFPGRDVNSIEVVDSDPVTDIDTFRVTATFLGLYGSSSPLPTFYTEDLLDEQRDDISITREFLDVINNPFYKLFYKVWKKNSLSLRYAEDPDGSVSDILFSLLGLGDSSVRREVPGCSRYLKYIGLTSQKPRSAEGLRVLLSDNIDEPEVQVHQCINSNTTIPFDQRCLLGVQGHELGSSSYIGSYIEERMGKFRIEFGPLSRDSFQRLLPDKPTHVIIEQSVQFYVDQPLDWDMELVVEGNQLETSRLGSGSWGKLGWNTWVFSVNKQPATGRVRLKGNCC